MTGTPDTVDYYPPIPAYELDFASYLSLNRCAWTLEAGQAALLIYDMQKLYVDRYEDPKRLLTNIAKIRAAAKIAGMPVIHAVAEAAAHVEERGIAYDLWGAGIGASAGNDDVHPDLAPTDDDFIIRKRKYSAFFRTDLEALLRRMNRSQIILCGNYANHGCMITTIDAYMRNFKVFFTADALGAHDAASHDMSLRYVADLCGKITLTNHVVEQISA